MLSQNDITKMAKTRLNDAIILYNKGRYDGSYYLCGYSIEIALKKKICSTLGWQGFPETNKEFKDLKCLKTHNLESLLLFSGIDSHIRQNFLADWSIVVLWNPEIRYAPVNKISQTDSKNIIFSAKKLIKEILT